MNLNSESDYNPLTTPTSERSSLFSQALPTNYSDMSDTEEDRQRVEMRMKVLYSMFHQILTAVSISVHSQTVHYKSCFCIPYTCTFHSLCLAVPSIFPIFSLPQVPQWAVSTGLHKVGID